MSQDLICRKIAHLKVDAEASIRNSSSKIERILNDGLPIFSDEVGSFSSNAEKFYISTSNREMENTTIAVKNYLNNAKWDLVNKYYINVLKNLDSLTNIIFCIQKNYFDNIQYINISQSYNMGSSIDNITTRSLRINEASKGELLISLYRRLYILRPFIEKINNEILRIPDHIITHKCALSTLNELLPIWKISINSQAKNESQCLYNRENKLSSVICLQLPLENIFFKQGSFVSRPMAQIDNNSLFNDVLVTLFFSKNKFNPYGGKYNLRASLKLPEFTSYLINNNYQLYVKTKPSGSESKNITSSTLPQVDFPSCIKSALAKQIHSTLHRVHWALIDRLIFHTIVQQVVNAQKDSPEAIYINELSSERVIFSINEASPSISFSHDNSGLEVKNISVSYKPISVENCFLSNDELNALKLLRESFLEIWRNSIKLNTDNLLENQMCVIKLSKYSNKLLERWIHKLAKKCINISATSL
ncbi:unnamed protein product [Cryptosporidium hominis]|uniref:Uncharacterized protein n=1 Tax=Cryptosporidium hominis TaxID=237895 RepID=A0A0S4TDL1_CRYHO|nr:hypothetical protein ChTU502y2012_401g0435 [Cryptosporidium hominis]PPA65213.1 hypothetical protein ChUKH1_16005 [Cryptosporidium hominis]CUV05141.1 unnamed protein product [Cryptosporidium hominis]